MTIMIKMMVRKHGDDHEREDKIHHTKQNSQIHTVNDDNKSNINTYKNNVHYRLDWSDLFHHVSSLHSIGQTLAFVLAFYRYPLYDQ